MRIAALAFGILAGLVASLILALGGLDVSPAASGDRQTQIIRFALFVIGNLGFFGAALALAAPLTAGLFLIIAALGWAGAALLLHRASDLVLIVPPILLLLAAIPAFIAHFRRPPSEPAPEPEIIAPMRRARPLKDEFDEEPDVGMPNFGEPPRRAAAYAAPGPDIRSDDDWNPGRRRTVPPRAKPAFRPTEDENDEPSGFSRFALGASSILSFGLYAALAGAALLTLWTFRGEFAGDSQPTVATAEVQSEALSEPAPVSSEPVLSPVLPAVTAPPAQPSVPQQAQLPSLPALGQAAAQRPPAATAQPVAVAPQPEQPTAEADFGDVVLSDDPLAPPRLVESTGLPFDESAVSSDAPPTAAPPSIEPEPAPEPEPQPEAPVEAAIASVPTVGAMMPRTMTPQMAAMRLARGTGPTIVTTPTRSAPADTGL